MSDFNVQSLIVAWTLKNELKFKVILDENYSRPTIICITFILQNQGCAVNTCI